MGRVGNIVMMAVRAALTESDLLAFAPGTPIEARVMAAHKLCRRLDAGVLDGADLDAARQILRIVATDPAEEVRRAVAVTLRSSRLIARDMALTFARDTESVASPILTASPALEDIDLTALIRDSGPMRQIAIARRETLPIVVVDTLVEHGSEAAVRAACANDAAEFSEIALNRAITRFASSQELLAAVSRRARLPAGVAERLAGMVGDRIRDQLIDHHGLSAETSVQIALGSRERGTIDLIDQAGRGEDAEGFVTHLKATGALTPSLLLRALAHGHMTFFEWGVAELAQAPHHRTWMMIHDAGPLGFRAIYERAGLPSRLFPAFRAGVETFQSMDAVDGPRAQEVFQQRMLERFLTHPATAAVEDVDYLLERAGAQKAAEAVSAPIRQTAAA